MDVEILLRRVDLIVSQHLFDLINGATHEKKILGIGVAQSVGGERESCLF
jgi:hypothetical protein